ncbi:hypothetical protein BGX34_010337, partial [Mortierella sp. NVP85]
MAGPTDNVFLPISIFVLNIALAIFKFILASAITACFAIYAKYGGEHSNSVGWIRSAGYIEMIKTFPSTLMRRNLAGSTKWALVVAFLATLSASLLDKGIVKFVTPAFKAGPPTFKVINSPQFSPNASQQMFVGWSFFVPNDDDVVGTMKKALNSSIAVSNLDKGRIHEPLTTGYNVTCTDFSIVLQHHVIRNGTGCPAVRLVFSTIEHPALLTMTERSPNRWSLTMASKPARRSYNILDFPMVLHFDSKDPKGEDTALCFHVEDYRTRSPIDVTNDITAFPRTSTTKCFHNNGNITALAITTARFTQSSDTYNYTCVSTIFADKSDDLLLGMKEAINTTALPMDSQPQNGTSTAWIELRVNNSSIDVYICGSSVLLDGDAVPTKFECVYSTISVLHFTQQLDNQLLLALEGRKFKGDIPAATTYMTLDHSTKIIGNKKAAPISIEKMRIDTMDVTQYMAELGYNYYADFDSGKLYIKYKISNLNLGLEVPIWVLVVATIILLISLVIWQATEWLVGEPHTCSLYSTIHAQLASRSNHPIPRLMRFRFQPLMLEDVPLFPDSVECLSEIETKSLPGPLEHSPEEAKDLPNQADRLS